MTKISAMDLEGASTKMALNMKGIGDMEIFMDRVYSHMLQETNSKGNGYEIKSKGQENWFN